MSHTNLKNDLAVSLKNVSKYFQDKKTIDDVSLDIRHGETFVIMGCSGSGKSTLLRLMTGAIQPDEGSVIIKGKDISRISRPQLDEVKNLSACSSSIPPSWIPSQLRRISPCPLGSIPG